MKTLASMWALMNIITVTALDDNLVKIKYNPEYYSKPGKSITGRCHQSNEYYLVDYNPFRPSTEVCDYYRCVNTYYVKESCPPGRGIAEEFIETAKKGIGHSLFPCTKRTIKCAPRNPGIRPNLKLCGIDLVWAVDVSCSVPDEDKSKVVDFIYKVISKFHVNQLRTQTGGLTYDYALHDIQSLKEGRNGPITLRNFENMVLEAEKCRTHTHEAIKQVHDYYFTVEAGNRPNFEDVLVLVTDGKTYIRKDEDNEAYSKKAIGYAEALRAEGVTIFVIGVRNNRKQDFVGMSEWLGITGNSSQIFLVDSVKDLAKKVDDMANNICINTVNQ